MAKIFYSNHSGPKRDALVFKSEKENLWTVECYELTSKHDSGPYATWEAADDFARLWVKEIK